jgi:hypothetical protein
VIGIIHNNGAWITSYFKNDMGRARGHPDTEDAM